MPIPDQLNRALERIAAAVSPSGAKWLVGGSTGLLLRGLELSAPPRDLDIYADDEAARTIHAALASYAVDDQGLSVSPIYRSLLSHYDIHGVQVELVGGFVVESGPDRYAVEVEAVLEPLKLTVEAGAYAVGVVPLAHELWFNVLRARPDRTEPIGRRIREERELHLDAVRLIAERNRFSAALQEQAAQWLTVN
ncbi:hypothetical protein [Paenibacillus sacheonensis]|uniref:Nucleotidyl transferase AbiEii/AbiGii toxin family protein n=1 Tax=Paenibacillus sacheonensis TaxID=742054 RepID=A0A7X4YMC9_9BACL|nr:hypothetical protein [Paenibacillus sacheonensis]MBM7564478.1 hypothetical protein [Paenibacillus sacheonensis]NBC69038.1 hypothetical protein [Paenibacillus sacheonensis]